MPPTLPLSAASAASAPHRNRQLFSDHYLDHVLPTHPAWPAARPRAANVLAAVREALAHYVPTTNEAATEEEFIRPVLRALGHVFEVQAHLDAAGGKAVPDYVFYADAASMATMKGRVLIEGEITGGLAIGDAKYWDRPLDVALRAANGTTATSMSTSTSVDAFSNRNPGWQIAFYLQHSGLPWGILTNGRLWRLYHRDSAHRLDRYFEVDVVALAESGDIEAFQYFSHFFGPEAMRPGALSLDVIRAQSEDYARGVGDHLKAQVYDALWHLAEGFVTYGPNGLSVHDGGMESDGGTPRNDITTRDRTLAEVHANALIVLYRILFVLFAEARGLLPLATNAGYRETYSFDAIKKDVAAKPDELWVSGVCTLWPKLQALWSIIANGQRALGVPTFNGGLFDDGKYPFLTRCAVPDDHLRYTIDMLARVNGQFVDYRDLAAQHLGTIYEGLLEYHLRLSPQGDPRHETLHGWTTELVTSNGERKASGSYYTPGYITRLMTERTLGPLVDRALSKTAGAPAEVRVQAVLAIDVLDPAMGSGHFLVEAIDYIAQRLVAADALPAEIGAAVPEGSASPAESAAFVNALPATNAGSIDELAYWKRRVAHACVYGVDINPLAVELAKLSIWLNTAAADRPLSFLDHHLRVGNSLVGVRMGNLRSEPVVATARSKASAKREAAARAAGQLSAQDDPGFAAAIGTAVGSMWLIEGSEGETIADIREQERLYMSLRDDLTRKFRREADLRAAMRFGLAVPAGDVDHVVALARGSILAAPAELTAKLAEATALATEWRFFHWELEFPEVFFDAHGQPLGDRAGFAAVLGNPPYVRQEALGDPMKRYLQAAYPETYSGVADLYVYFYQRGYELLQSAGRMSLIVTNKWMRAGYGERLRAWFAEQCAVESVIDFGHAPIFPDADVFPCIVWLERPSVVDVGGGNVAVAAETPTSAEAMTRVAEFPREQLGRVDIAAYVDKHGHAVSRRRFTSAPWSLEPEPVVALLEKIRRAGVPLVEYSGVKPYRGVLTGLNEAFLIDTPTRDRLVREDPRSAGIIKPYLRGQDIRRWAPEWAGLWMIVLASSGNVDWPWADTSDTVAAEEIFAQHQPALHRFLKSFEGRLRIRSDRGEHWWELRSCAYYELFEARKLLYQEIQFHPSVALSEGGYFINNKVFLLPSDDEWLLAVLGSPLMWWHNWRYLPHMKDEALSPAAFLVEPLPIAPLIDASRANVDHAVARLITLTQVQHDTSHNLTDWLRAEFSVDHLGQALERIDTIDWDTFVAEVRKRRPKAAAPLSPAAVKALRHGYDDIARPARERAGEVAALERVVAEAVNEAYGLTEEDVQLMWRTAPPRMPGVGPQGA